MKIKKKFKTCDRLDTVHRRCSCLESKVGRTWLVNLKKEMKKWSVQPVRGIYVQICRWTCRRKQSQWETVRRNWRRLDRADQRLIHRVVLLWSEQLTPTENSRRQCNLQTKTHLLLLFRYHPSLLCGHHKCVSDKNPKTCLYLSKLAPALR